MQLRSGETKWIWISENVKTLLGYTTEEAMEPDWWFRNVSAVDRLRTLGAISKLGKYDVSEQEYQFRKKDKSSAWIRDVMRVAYAKGAITEIVGTLTDISDRKRAESELSLKSAALDAAANAVVITDRDGTIKWLNPAFERLSGYSSQEALGKNPRALVKSGKEKKALYQEMWDAILSGRIWRGELINKRKAGEFYTEEMTITPVKDESGRIQSFIAIKNDITERREAHEKLEFSLREKDVLLREVHHRVKNNMQIITSLMHLSIDTNVERDYAEVISEVSRRIQSMAMIHDQFYESSDVARIDFSDYLDQLIKEVRIRCPERLVIECEAEQVFLDLGMAIPAGLLISELLENALRILSLGTSGDGGVIRMEQRIVDDATLEIIVRDNGVALSGGLDYQGSSAFSLELMQILSEQLHGSLLFKASPDAAATLRFPLPSP